MIVSTFVTFVDFKIISTNTFYAVQNANNFEMFSKTSAGAIQGNGYQCRNAGWVLPLVEL